MTHSVRQVCVIGATLGGLACAIAAANHGLHVELMDDGADSHDIPVPVELVPNALRALVGLGVGGAAVRVGFPYLGAEVLDPHGQRIQELVYERLAGARYPAALGIRYAELLAGSPGCAELCESFSRRRMERVKRVYELVATAAGWDVEPDSGADIGQLVEVMASTTSQPA